MVFSSNVFLFFFLPITILLYYLCPRKIKNYFLLFASFVFYSWGELKHLSLMIIVILLNYAAARLIVAERKKWREGKFPLIFAIVINLGLLAYYKYTGFLVQTWNALTPGAMHLGVPSILLPLGISFYVFQSMSYTIDVYRREADCQNNPFQLACYVSMFPQLIAGPIVRYRDIAEQLNSRKECPEQFVSGIRLFIIGLSKKLLLANQMGALWEALHGTTGTFSAWICMSAYTLQIYYDFSGYSDMAIGLGRMFGFEFLKNFNYPYISKSITEFWRRWHISLGTWFREYVYIPLGGNRKGQSRQILNLLVVWALTGLWHGASWNFVLWGLYYGVILILEKLFLLKVAEKTPNWLRHGIVILIVSFGWVLFSFTDFSQLKEFVQRLFCFASDSRHEINLVLAYLPLIGIGAVLSTPLLSVYFSRFRNLYGYRIFEYLMLCLLLLLCISSLASKSYNPFIYFRF